LTALRSLLCEGQVLPGSVGIITPYNAQVIMPRIELTVTQYLAFLTIFSPILSSLYTHFLTFCVLLNFSVNPIYIYSLFITNIYIENQTRCINDQLRSAPWLKELLAGKAVSKEKSQVELREATTITDFYGAGTVVVQGL